jgi:hypothetical protein
MDDWQKLLREQEREKLEMLRDLAAQQREMQSIMQANLEELRRFKAWLGGKTDFYPDEKEGEVNVDQ